MGEQLDYTTLAWVKDEIQESLNQTHQALEAFIEDPSDTTQIRFCATYLHQIYGTLQMVEIYGAALLAEEMEKVANALLNNKISQQQDAFEVLIRATLQLPAYLERLEQGQPDLPVVLTSLLNDLRAARGEPLLSENAFFSPDLNIEPPEKRLAPGKEYPEIQSYAKKLRPIFQLSLLGVLRDKDRAGSLKKMAAVLRELQNASESKTLQRLWWVAGGIVESLIDGGLEGSTALKMLLGHVDREIRRVIKDGEIALDNAPPSDLIKNCLYYAGTSTSNGPRVSTLKQAFNLDKLLPYSNQNDQGMDDLKGSTADIMGSVSSVIKDDLLHVKDQLDIYVRNAEHQITDLTPLADNLSRTADTLAMLSLADLRKVIQDQASNLYRFVETNEDPADSALMEVASALLYVESALDHFKESVYAESAAPDLSVSQEAESSEVLLPRSEQVQITNLVIKEAKEVLADVKEGFNTFAVEPNQFDAIADAPEKLAQIQGALAVMNLERAAKLLGAANAFIREDVLSAHANPDPIKLDTLADAITSIEYYLEAIEERRTQPENILAVAEISVEQLGHPIESVSSIINVETAAPLATESVDEEKLAPAEIMDEEIALDSEPLADDEFATPSVDQTQEIDTTALIDMADQAEAFETSEPNENLSTEADTATELPGEPEVEEYLDEDIDEEILEIFVEEADEVLGTMTDCLHAWRANNDDKKSLETLRRSYHTIKGSGRLAGAMVMGEFAWAIENMLNRVLDNKISPTPAMFTLMENAETVVRQLLAHLKKETDKRPPIKALAAQADAMSDGAEFSVSDIVTIASPSTATPSPEVTIAEDIHYESEQDLEQLEEPVLDTTDELLVEETVSPVEAEQEITLPEESLLDIGDELLVEEAVSSEETEKQSFEEESLSLESSINELEDIALDLTTEPELDTDLEFGDFEVDEAYTPPALTTHDSPLVEVFRNETANHIGTIRDFLLRAGGNNTAVDDDLHRAFHTLHGSARMADVAAISELSEPMDRLIRAMHDRGMTVDAEGQNLIRSVADQVEFIAASFTNDDFISPDNTEILNQISQLYDSVTSLPLVTELEDAPITLDTAGEGASSLSEEDDELISVFVEEADEILNNSDAMMQQWANSADNDLAAVSELQRSLHTLKGGARLANITAVGDLTHDLETALERVTEGGNASSHNLPDLVQQGLDWLVRAINDIRNGTFPNDATELREQIANLSSATPSLEMPQQETLDSAAHLLEAETVDERLTEDKEPTVDIEETLEENDLSFDDLEIDQVDTLAETLEEEAYEELSPFTANIEDDFLEAKSAADITTNDQAEAASAATEVDYDPDLLEVFLEEAEELQESTENTLQIWLTDCSNLEPVAELQRLLHTLKGGARMANVLAVGDLAHAMESLLERITDGRTKPEPGHINLIQSCHDWLITALETASKLQPISAPDNLLAELNAAIKGEKFHAADVSTETSSLEVNAEPVAEINVEKLKEAQLESASEQTTKEELEELSDAVAFELPTPEETTKQSAPTSDEQIRVRADLLNNLVNFSGEINIYNSRIAQQLGASRFNLAELDQTVARLHEQLRKFEIETETQIMYRHETTSSDAEDFDPLELDRFSTMQQLSRGMVESLGDLTSIQALLDNLSSETDVLLLQQQRVTSELQDGLLRTRMVSFSSVLPRLRRIMRQTCKEIGKEAELVVTGGEGEIDRTQLNRIVPALEHILRNAIGHGLELPEQRQKQGKPATGNVHIVFAHQGSEVVLTISDDGAGIDIDNLRKKAIEKGRMLADADLTDHEIMEFILESGFSTAEQVTQLSGRGVGMDVVNTEVKQLGGTLHINSEAGKGTTFILRLPLTVLVNQALMVQVSDATYAIQLPNIEHVVRVGNDELLPLINHEQPAFEYAGNRYQYLNLGTVLHGTPALAPQERQRVPLMLIRSADHRIALHVDNLIGRQEIVIKSVGPQLSSVGVLSGATILPDGKVALILDIGNLVRSALAQQHAGASPLLPTAAEVSAQEETVPTVMIVDDSITVRKVTERLLKRYEYNIITAKDGVDALTVMLEQIPDIMLLDVEMPRMDGYELATTMRNDQRLKDVPIIMITSRTGDKHRQRALDIGVNMYMGKPYQEQELIENIRTLTGVEQG